MGGSARLSEPFTSLSLSDGNALRVAVFFVLGLAAVLHGVGLCVEKVTCPALNDPQAPRVFAVRESSSPDTFPGTAMTMPAIVALAATILGGATLSFTTDTSVRTAPPRKALAVPVNGDFNQFLPEGRSNYANEVRQHSARLQTIERVLRSRDLSDIPAELRAERSRNLDRLHDYWMRAEYPTVPAHDGPIRPCFIDDAGRICAVGYLVEKSAGRDVAERINAKYRPNTIREINDPALAAWIASSGLSYDEVVAIQGPEMRMAQAVNPVVVSIEQTNVQQSTVSQNSDARARIRRTPTRRVPTRRTENVAPVQTQSESVESLVNPSGGLGAALQVQTAEPVIAVPVEEPSVNAAPAVTEPVRVESAQPVSHIE